METSLNGHEGEDDLNGAGQYDQGNGDAQAGAQGNAGADGTAGDDENGADGGQIDASKGEEDAGYVIRINVLNTRSQNPLFLRVFVGAMCRSKGDGRVGKLKKRTLKMCL